MVLWAADTPVSTPDPVTWINYGVMGLLLAGLVAGLFWVKPAVDNLKEQIVTLRRERDEQIAQLRLDIGVIREERDRAYNKVDAMADTYRIDLLPSLNKFLTTTQILLPLLQKMVDRPGGDQR